MKKKPLKNVAASMRAKLLDRARERKEDFQFILDRWVAERFLYRLGKSDQREIFVLKGATLFLVWQGKLPRPTRDIDLLGYGSAQVGDVVEDIRQICSVEAGDGLIFDFAGVKGEEIREEADYGGVRVFVPATLDGAKSQLQIDIGFGDAVDPVEETSLPVMLDLEPPRVKAYPPEAAIAEKLQAMVHLGVANSRMKDLFDIWTLSRNHEFLMSRLRKAVGATFSRRKTPLPGGRPTALSETFLKDKGKIDQWKAFLSRMGLSKDLAELVGVGEAVAGFLMPVIDSARAGGSTERKWPPGGPWKN